MSWIDVAVLAVWHGLIIGAGFYGAVRASTFAVLAIVGAIAAFWISIWQLFGDSARRMQATMDEFERLAAQQQRGRWVRMPRPARSRAATRRSS